MLQEYLAKQSAPLPVYESTYKFDPTGRYLWQSQIKGYNFISKHYYNLKDAEFEVAELVYNHLLK